MEVQGGLQGGRNVAPGQRMQVQRSRVGQMLSNLTTSRVIVGAQRCSTVQGLQLPAELLSALHVWGSIWWSHDCRAVSMLAAHCSSGRGRLVTACMPWLPLAPFLLMSMPPYNLMLLLLCACATHLGTKQRNRCK